MKNLEIAKLEEVIEQYKGDAVQKSELLIKQAQVIDLTKKVRFNEVTILRQKLGYERGVNAKMSKHLLNDVSSE